MRLKLLPKRAIVNNRQATVKPVNTKFQVVEVPKVIQRRLRERGINFGIEIKAVGDTYIRLVSRRNYRPFTMPEQPIWSAYLKLSELPSDRTNVQAKVSGNSSFTTLALVLSIALLPAIVLTTSSHMGQDALIGGLVLYLLVSIFIYALAKRKQAQQASLGVESIRHFFDSELTNV